MAQSFVAIKREGVISVIGFLGGLSKAEPSFLETLNTSSIVRGIMVGSRVQLEELTRAIDVNLIKPEVDEKVFSLEELKDCYQYMVSDLWNPMGEMVLMMTVVGPEAFRMIIFSFPS